MAYAGMSVRPIGARYVRKPVVAGPFNCNCRTKDGVIRASFHLRCLGRDDGARFWKLKPARELAWARGVVESAMRAMWGEKPSLTFKENGHRWEIVKLRVKAPSRPH